MLDSFERFKLQNFPQLRTSKNQPLWTLKHIHRLHGILKKNFPKLWSPKNLQFYFPAPQKNASHQNRLSKPHLCSSFFITNKNPPQKIGTFARHMSLHWSWRGSYSESVRFLNSSSRQLDSKKIEEIQVSIKCMVNWWLTSLQNNFKQCFLHFFHFSTSIFDLPAIALLRFLYVYFPKTKKQTEAHATFCCSSWTV